MPACIDEEGPSTGNAVVRDAEGNPIQAEISMFDGSRLVERFVMNPTACSYLSVRTEAPAKFVFRLSGFADAVYVAPESEADLGVLWVTLETVSSGKASTVDVLSVQEATDRGLCTETEE